MKRRFQRTMGLILCITLIISCALFSGILYSNNLAFMQEEVKKEAQIISTAINVSDDDYIDTIIPFLGESRVTLIATDGTVLYDTDEAAEDMENHGLREEVIEAYSDGVGCATRMSDTLGDQTYYYAILLEDGDVIRVSSTMNSVVSTLLYLVPIIFLMGVLLWIIAMYIIRRETKKMIEPINTLDVDNPLNNVIYEELQPLLMRIDNSNKAREEVAEMRKEFSANVSHELKTPLTSISGYAELLQNGMVKPEHISRFAGRIHTEATRLVVLIEDIIKLSKLDEGSIELEKEEVDLFFMVREICSRLSLQAYQKKVHMEISGQSVKYKGVKQVLDEMIYNICENAIKYNKENGNIDIWVGATLEGAKIVVRDTGIGIPIDQHDRVFERFYRVDKSHSKETGGTGLGLSIVKHGAILHGADIKLESEIGKGTKIEILFV
ncbi:MAG: ATP-binding protein [Eubacteriales bacterium]